MGCDIHSYAEKLNESGKWEKVGKVFENIYWRENEPNKVDNDGYEWNPQFTSQPYNGRNYDLFAILADVRNGRGFAGCITGDGFIPIADPKGLPEDISEEVKKESDSWKGDGHSHSWFTVSELLAYDWNQVTTHRGWVTYPEYQNFKEYGKPKSWCGDVSGRGIKKVTPAQMENINPDSNISYYCQVQWKEKYSDSCQHFINKTIPALQAIGNPDEVRIVFWFDN